MTVPPALTVETTGLPTRTLYSPVQIALAALLGAPGAAGWFIGRNELRLDRPANARRWLLGSVIGTVVLLVVVMLLPVSFPRQSLGVGYVAGFYVAAKNLYGNLIQEHQAAGGSIGSWWKVVGISLLFLLLFLVLTLVVAFLMPASVTNRFVPATDP